MAIPLTVCPSTCSLFSNVFNHGRSISERSYQRALACDNRKVIFDTGSENFFHYNNPVLDMPRQIILAIDGSSYGERAFCWYLSNLYREGDEVHVVTINDMSQVPVPFVVGPEPMVIPDDWEENIKRSYEDTKKLLNSLVQRLSDKKISCKGHLRNSHGSPGAEICKLADEYKADCILVGSRGMGTIRRTFLGSTSDYVLHHAHCPVLVVKHHQE